MKRIPIIVALTLMMAACAGGSKTEASNAASEEKAFAGVPSFNADSAYAFVERQVDFGPRNPGSEGHERCRSYLVSELKRMGADTVIVQNVPVKTFTGETFTANNILARYNPEENDRILLVAHWDTRPWADQDPLRENHEKPVTGANDGASGVGVLLEIARQLNATPLKNTGIDILFADVEDSGQSDTYGDSENSWCLGTQEWVKDMPYNADNKPAYGILLDMVGGHNARFLREYFSNLHASDIVNKVWAVANKSGFGNRFVNTPGGAVVDDHMFISRAGIPCIDIIENANPDTGSFNPTWHTGDDTMEGIDRTTLGAVGQVVMNTIYSDDSRN